MFLMGQRRRVWRVLEPGGRQRRTHGAERVCCGWLPDGVLLCPALEHRGLVGHHLAFLGCLGVQSMQLGSQEGTALLSGQRLLGPLVNSAGQQEERVRFLCSAGTLSSE